MISGAARLIAHGSAAAVVVGATTGGGGANDGGAVAGAAGGTVGSGVLDTVESPEPHPATATVAATMRTAHFTTAAPYRQRHRPADRRAAGKPTPNH